MSLLASMILLISADAAAQVDPVQLVEPDPKSMTQKQIREFNAKLTRDHPFYIRCVKTDELGSLVRKTLSCRTNHQWQLADKSGNQNARDTVEAMTSKATNTN